MMFNHNEIIEEITAHIRKSGGDPGEWCVGTAKDARGPFFRRHLVADLHDGLLYREAFTTTAAGQVIDHLVKNCGVKLAFEAERRAGMSDGVPEAGKLVFVYRPKDAKCDAAPPDAASSGDVKSPLQHAV